MERKDKANLIGVLILFCILLGYIYFINDRRSKFNKLDNEGVLDTAIVVRKGYGAKGKLYYHYVWYVNNYKYEGSLQYSVNYGPVSIGDSFLVNYLKEDPDEINELVMNKDRTLIVVTKE